jgi:hypothetical protein
MVDALTKRTGDLPEVGDARLNNMKQVFLKPQNLPKQLHLFVDRLPAQGHPSIPDLMIKAYVTDPLRRKILVAIRKHCGFGDISIPECMPEDGKIQYRGSLDVPENDTLHLQLITAYHDSA